MIRLKNILIIFSLISIIISACKKDDKNPDNTDYKEYFSSTVGTIKIYKVDSVYWTFGPKHDSLTYQVKEIITETIPDNTGRPTQRVERYLLDTAGNWKIWKVWTSNITSTTAEQVEDNIRFIKFILPPSLNTTWDGNAFNNLEEMDYKITALNIPDTKGNLSFDSTLTVLQNDFRDNIVTPSYSEERYSKGTGLYYRYNEFYHINIINTASGTLRDTDSAYVYTETLLSVTH